MAGEPDPTPDPDPGLTPEQERRVRSLLADARHAEPMPADVAARLDRVLAELASGEPVPPVVPLAARRRRRRAATMLVAAAAVVAVGVGLGQLLPTGGESGGSASSTADRAMTSDVPDSGRDVSRSPRSRPERSGGIATNGQAASAPQGLHPSPGSDLATLAGFGPPLTVRPDHFSRDVTRARRTVASYAASDRARGGDLDQRSGFSCIVGHWGRGHVVPVRYGQRHAVLVLRPVRGDTQVVDLFRCGGSEVLRSITLPAR